MSDSSPVTAVIINFKTPELTRRAVETFRIRYSSLPLLLIDNGSGAASAAELRHLQEAYPDRTELLLNPRNIHHGPAMDQALHRLPSRYILFIDSDCEVRREGFVEQMTCIAGQEPGVYAVGKRIFMNARGFDVEQSAGAHAYIRPICMLINREAYLTLPPFERHGAPCLRNMIAAAASGLKLVHFPVEDYVRHEVRVTAARYGYRLGVKGKVNHLLNRLGL